MTKEQLNQVLPLIPAHNTVSHEFKSAKKTGFRMGCFRCRVLFGYPLAQIAAWKKYGARL